MAVVKAGLAALAICAAALMAAEEARAQTNAPGAAVTPPGARPARKGVQAQAPAAQPKAPASTPTPTVTPGSTPAATPAPVAKAPTRGPDQEYKECLNLWDAATHMTRKEWAATCRRVQNRLNDITAQAKNITVPNRRRVR